VRPAYIVSFIKQNAVNDIVNVGKLNFVLLYNYFFRDIMGKSSLILVFWALALLSSAQSSSSMIVSYQHVIRSEEARIRAELKVDDPVFFGMIDTVSKYCSDSKFSLPLQLQNVQGLMRFLKKVNSKEIIRTGQCTNLLLFYFSVMDWRKEGNFYENLSSYSSFAMKCASFFSEDTAGMQFIIRFGQEYPDEILTNAEQLSDNTRYKRAIEDAILKDPEFAKRYFYSDNTVSYYAANSQRRDVQSIYDLFKKYGTKTNSYILYDDIKKNLLTPEMSESIALDNTAMIEHLVGILKRENPAAIRSVIREMDYRSTDWMRQSTKWIPAAISLQFNKFSPDERFTMLVFGYRECSPEQLNVYLSLLQSIDLETISPILLDNLASGNLQPFLHFLDKQDKLPVLLSYLSDGNKEKLSKMLASDDNEIATPISFESFSKSLSRSAEMDEIGRSEAVDNHQSVLAGRGLSTNTVAPYDPSDGMVIEPIHIPLSDSSRDILALKRNIYLALQDISSFIQKPYAKDLLMYAATVEPDEVFKKVDMYKTKYWSKDILEEATLNAPLSAKRYFNSVSHPVTVLLSNSQDTIIKKFLELSKEAKYESKPFLLFDEMVSQCLTLADATTICSNNYSLFKELMSIASQKNYIGRYNVEREMNYYALRYIRSINDKADLPEKDRYASVENLGCDELYYLMVYGREEVFNGTFNGLFSRFQNKCATSGYWNAKRFITLPHYRSFIAMCAAYNKLDKFLSLFSPGDQNILLTTFASSLDKERDELSDAATVAETVANTSNSIVLQVLQNTIKASYLDREIAHDYNGMAIYGILSAMFKDKAVSDRKWFAIMAKKYKVGSLTTLTNASLMASKIFVERMYFYDDQDGHDSYKSFLAIFSASPNWKIDQYFSYVKVSSISGKKIEIYANKPELEESGDREISKIIMANNYIVQGVMHRGHSFHTETTLEKLPASTRFLFIGSCGGFYKINMALRKAPDAQIISTRQIGAQQINDPIIFSFNEYVRQGMDINWKIFWDEMSGKLANNSLFNDYVPPHKNLESLFVRAYYQIMGNE
jgi:hypothetical protein